jgi:hypothetical protein
VRANEQLGNWSGCKRYPKNVKQVFLILVSFKKPENETGLSIMILN